MRVIVHDFRLDVNEYASLGAHPPMFVPETCPACACEGRLCGHGVRTRGVWLAAAVIVVVIFVRRLSCACCGKCFTVLPCFLHPRRRYALEVIESTVVERFVDEASFSALESVPCGPAPSTQRDWCKAISLHAELWLSALTGWLARLHAGMVVPCRVYRSEVSGLLATALQSSDWCAGIQEVAEVLPGQLLQRLWLWGHERVQHDLLPPTRGRAGPYPYRFPTPRYHHWGDACAR